MAKVNDNFKVNGILRNVIVNSINKKMAFPDDKSKAKYLHLIMFSQAHFPNVKILSYAILNDSAYLLLYSSDESFINKFMLELNENYNRYYCDIYDYHGYIFRLPNQIDKIKKDAVPASIAHINKMSEYSGLTKNYRNYKFSSCKGLFKGNNKIVDKSLVLAIVGLKKLSGEVYTLWHRSGMNKSISRPKNGIEKFNQVFDTSIIRYKGTGDVVNEHVLKQLIMEINERCEMPYIKTSKKLGIPANKRRDILIEVIASMVFDRKYSYLDAINQLQVSEFGEFALLLEVITSVNMNRHYGYDYIINALKVEDRNYDILVELLRNLRRDYGYGFVEMAKFLNLQNAIIDVRNRVNF